MHVDDPNGDSLSCQLFRRLQGHLHHHTHSHHGNILSVPEQRPLANGKLVSLHTICHRLHCQASQTHVGRSFISQKRPDRLPHLIAVAGAQNRHIGNGTHNGQILNALMGCPVLSNRQSAMGTHHFHIQAGIRHTVAHLFPSPSSGKHREGIDEGFLSTGGQSSSHPHHIGLRDPHIKKTVRVGCGKLFGHCGARQVSIQNHQIRLLIRQFHQCLAISGTGRNFLCHLTSPPFPPGQRPAPAAPADTVPRWEPCHAIQPGSP